MCVCVCMYSYSFDCTNVLIYSLTFPHISASSQPQTSSVCTHATIRGMVALFLDG